MQKGGRGKKQTGQNLDFWPPNAGLVPERRPRSVVPRRGGGKIVRKQKVLAGERGIRGVRKRREKKVDKRAK